jgi:DNA invertase Pin-like site-specific DNA recombinase
MLRRLTSNGATTIIVESPDRFARDLAVQLAGHDMLKELGIAIIPASAPDFFTEDTPTAILVRQVLGAIAQFEKASAVAKLFESASVAPTEASRLWSHPRLCDLGGGANQLTNLALRPHATLAM